MVQVARQKELRNLVFPRDLIDQQPSGMIGASLVILPVNECDFHTIPRLAHSQTSSAIIPEAGARFNA